MVLFLHSLPKLSVILVFVRRAYPTGCKVCVGFKLIGSRFAGTAVCPDICGLPDRPSGLSVADRGSSVVDCHLGAVQRQKVSFPSHGTYCVGGTSGRLWCSVMVLWVRCTRWGFLQLEFLVTTVQCLRLFVERGCGPLMTALSNGSGS